MLCFALRASCGSCSGNTLSFLTNISLKVYKLSRGDCIRVIMQLRHNSRCAATSVFVFCLLVFMTTELQAHPIENPEHALRNMQQIPQWHCLRYRRFDLVKRCRNYRVAQISTHHDSSESLHIHRIPPLAMGSFGKPFAEK